MNPVRNSCWKDKFEMKGEETICNLTLMFAKNVGLGFLTNHLTGKPKTIFESIKLNWSETIYILWTKDKNTRNHSVKFQF